MSPTTAADLIRLGLADHGAGRLDAAAQRYRQVLTAHPDDPDALHLLGLIAHRQGRSAEAVDLIRRAVRASPGQAGFWFNLGTVLASAGDDAAAAPAFAEAGRLQPDHADAHVGLANAFQRLGQLHHSAAALAAAVRLQPTRTDLLLQLGQTLFRLDRWDGAVEAYQRALAMDPGHVGARRHLAVALNAVRRTDESLAEYRRLLACGELDASHHSNYLYALLYADTPPADVTSAAAAWAQAHAPQPTPPPVHIVGRRIRVGYVSGDFRDHPVGRLIAPLLAGHHQTDFDVACYSSRPGTDPTSRYLRGLTDQWRDVYGLSDAALAEQVRADGITVLVDLSGHTAHNRLPMFARRPTPVQVTYLGYPATGGLTAIDYRFTDAWADPPGMTEAFHTERLVRLPQCFLCYAPPADAPPVDPPPAAVAGQLTFGSFNAAAKLGPATVRLWAAALRAVPNSRLVLKATGLQGAATQDRLRADFADAGVDPNRIEVLPTDPDHAQHLARYGRIDVALDPHPYNGTMTTLDALWMGVPTLTLAGRSHVSRVGVSLMSNAGLGDWVADSAERFVALAERWAGDPDGLRDLRRRMRDRLRSAPLTDAARHVRDVESAYADRVRHPAGPNSG